MVTFSHSILARLIKWVPATYQGEPDGVELFQMVQSNKDQFAQIQAHHHAETTNHLNS